MGKASIFDVKMARGKSILWITLGCVAVVSLTQSFWPTPTTTSSCPLRLELGAAARFQVKMADEIWLKSAELRFFADGRWHTSTGSTMKEVSRHQYEATDELGHFSCDNVTWHVASPNGKLLIHTSFKTYLDSCLVILTQEVPQGANVTNASKAVMPADGHHLENGTFPPILSFPSFAAETLENLGFLTWKDVMAQAAYGKGIADRLAGLISNGPVVIFNQTLSLVVSPLDNFKNAVHTYSQNVNAWETGVSSELTSLPAGFCHRTLIMAGVGITPVIDAYGQTMRRIHATDRSQEASDPVINYLSYWTDNGAYYYGDQWKEAPGGGAECNETSMTQVAEGLEKQNLLNAVRIWQLDDWWYPGHMAVFVDCVENWTLVPPAFNKSLRELSDAIGKPWLLYVPFLCPSNVYTKQFRFLKGSNGSTEFAVPHPDDALAFYRMLFDYGIANRMAGFEHDFLNFNFLAVPHFRENLGASRRWLQAMDQAAAERQLAVQFCMALPSDLMQTLEFRSTTNYRASGDYSFLSNFDIGASSLLAFALNLRPSKDNLWTHRPEEAAASGKPWGPHENPGSNCELNLIIATLSTGPVGISDKAGDTNATLLLRSIRSDGLLLQPDKPATSIDASFVTVLDGQKQFQGHIWSTYAEVNVATKKLPWHYLLSIDVNKTWQLRRADFYPLLDMKHGWVARKWHQMHRPTPCLRGHLAVKSGCLLGPGIVSESNLPNVLNDRPVMVANDTYQFDLLQLSPVFANGWVLLGELDKYVSVSRKRFPYITVSSAGISVEARGVRNEEIKIVALQPVELMRDPAGEILEWNILEKTVRFETSDVVEVQFTAEVLRPRQHKPDLGDQHV